MLNDSEKTHLRRVLHSPVSRLVKRAALFAPSISATAPEHILMVVLDDLEAGTRRVRETLLANAAAAASRGQDPSRRRFDILVDASKRSRQTVEVIGLLDSLEAELGDKGPISTEIRLARSIHGLRTMEAEEAAQRAAEQAERVRCGRPLGLPVLNSLGTDLRVPAQEGLFAHVRADTRLVELTAQTLECRNIRNTLLVVDPKKGADVVRAVVAGAANGPLDKHLHVYEVGALALFQWMVRSKKDEWERIISEVQRAKPAKVVLFIPEVVLLLRHHAELLGVTSWLAARTRIRNGPLLLIGTASPEDADWTTKHFNSFSRFEP
jgi:hypothetical protein